MREFKQPGRRRQQERDKFAYLTMKNNTFARSARAFLAGVLVLSTTWNDQFCICVDDVSTWWQMFNYVLVPLKRWFQFNSRIVRTHFASLRTLNNWKMIAGTRSYIFRWRSQCSRRRLCLSSLLIGSGTAKKAQNYKTREKLCPGNAKRYRNLTQRESLLFQLQKTIKMSLISLINFWFVASSVKM